MADEQNGAVEQSQAEAEKKSALPESVKINDGNAPVERGEYLKLVESSKDVVKKYNETSFESFMNRIGSDGAFAQQVVSNLISGNEVKNVGVHPDSPQELNRVGRVDRTKDIPERITFEGQAQNPPVNALE